MFRNQQSNVKEQEEIKRICKNSARDILKAKREIDREIRCTDKDEDKLISRIKSAHKFGRHVR